MARVSGLADIREWIAGLRVVAVLGAHTARERAAFYVPEYLHTMGIEVWAVNPTKVGQPAWGHPFVASLADIPVPVDAVDVFRRADLLPAHLPEILSMSPLPPLVWLQLGIRSDEVADALSAAGIAVVEDRCLLADHQRWRIAPVARR